jgi:hypothetical protein
MASAKGERPSCHTFKTNRERAKALLSLAASSAKLGWAARGSCAAALLASVALL